MGPKNQWHIETLRDAARDVLADLAEERAEFDAWLEPA